MKKILIIQTASIGDVILTTPIIEKLHEFYPKAAIDFLLRKGTEDLFFNHPYIREVIVFNRTNNKILSLLNLIKKTRRGRYDCVINVQRFFSSGLITALSGAKDKTGFRKNPFSLFFSNKVEHDIGTDSTWHETERNLKLVEHLTDKQYIKPRLYPKEFSHNLFNDERKYICIAPASLWFTKQYPKEKWIELIQLFDESLTICLLGSKDDQPLCEDIKHKCHGQQVFNFAGKFTLLETAQVMKQALMNFVNDSAPMHLASSVNAPVSVIYCSTVPAYGFGPLSDNSFIFEPKEVLRCRPCGLHGYKKCPEKHFKCSEIDPLNLFEAIKTQ